MACPFKPRCCPKTPQRKISRSIFDPAKVVRIALQDAASVAGLLLTTEAAVAETPKQDDGAGHGHGGMGGMGGMM